MQYAKFFTALLGVSSALVVGCGTAPSGQATSVSEPGGFVDPAQRLAADDDDTYCSSQVLRWRYEAGVLQLADSRLVLNCCGRRALHVERVDNVIEITEQDEPTVDGARCNAMCAFDYAAAVPDVIGGKAYLKLLRDITDAQGSAELVWEGELDLRAGTGSVVLNDAPEDASCADTERVAVLSR